MFKSSNWAYKNLVIPDHWDTLENFVHWYKDSNFPIMPPADMKIYVTDISFSCIVFRKHRYQVEMYMLKPNAFIPSHSHDFDLQIIHLGGSMLAFNNGKSGKIGLESSLNSNADIPHQSSGTITEKLVKNTEHKFYTFSQGELFFNIEEWDPETEKTSATLEYSGTPLGPMHSETLNNLKKSKSNE